MTALLHCILLLRSRGQVAPGEHLDDGVLPSGTASGAARPTGKVVGVIKRNWRTRGYCGSLQPQEERGGRGAQGVLFCPVERRFPKIRLQTRQVSHSQPVTFETETLMPNSPGQVSRL